jgi:hypothetical protein
MMNTIQEDERKYIPERIRKFVNTKIAPFKEAVTNSTNFAKRKIYWERKIDKKYDLSMTRVALLKLDEKEKFAIDPA